MEKSKQWVTYPLRRPINVLRACKAQGAIEGTNTSGRRVLPVHGRNVIVICSSDIASSTTKALLRKKFGCEADCFTADVGQASGASHVKDYAYPCLGAGACFERKYLLPVIIKGDITWDLAYEPKKEMYMMLVDQEDAPCLPNSVAAGLNQYHEQNCKPLALMMLAILFQDTMAVQVEHLMIKTAVMNLLTQLICVQTQERYQVRVSIDGKVLVPAILLSDINDIGGTILTDSWFNILCKSMDALMENVTETTGLVTVKVYKGIVREDTLSSENSHGNA